MIIIDIVIPIEIVIVEHSFCIIWCKQINKDGHFWVGGYMHVSEVSEINIKN